jgi:ectoine hydroxylase-related dioxygenase (phytanoyl-CoA dioxygenase family)
LRELSAEELEIYHRDGVLMAQGLMADEWFEQIERAVVKVMAAPTPIAAVFSDPKAGFHMEAGLFTTDDDIRNVVYRSPMSRIAQQLMNSQKVHFFYDQMFCKTAGNQNPTPWHHDLTFWPIDGEQVCSMWIPLDPVSKESSGLEFVRGSHTWPHRYKAITPMYNESMIDPDHEDVPDIEANRADYDIASFQMEPGDILIFHPLTLHGSGPNVHLEQRRRALSFRWIGDEVVYAPTPCTMPYAAAGLEPGEIVRDPAFPQVLPPVAAARP